MKPQRSGGVALIDHASPLTMALWGVNHPAAGFGVANSAMVLLQKVHGLGFTAAGELSPPAPG